jgi:protein tyrosine phosphatase (PTP) superfamily phosphohydrolase (DUF442 family)
MKTSITLAPCLLLLLAMFTPQAATPASGAEKAQDPSVAWPSGVRPLEAPGLHNLFALGTNVFSGSAPEGDEAFAALAKLGVKTIITVDGAKPEVETARKHGIRYVHLPHGYDGIGTNLQLQIVKAAQTLPGPVYVHCHHGKHRGPAAAAVICMANQGWTATQAEAWLLAAGTATNYTGLYGVVREFHKPTLAQLGAIPSAFPETAKVSALVDAMVGIDERWDHLKAVRAAGYQMPKDHPDLKPANEAVILWELYREAQRLPDAVQRGQDFIKHLVSAEAGAKEVEQVLRQFAAQPKPELRAQLDKAFDAMAQTCIACHGTFRDRAGTKP